MQNNIIPLVRRILAGLFSWLVIAIAALYLGGKILPHLGIGASLEMAFHSGLAIPSVFPSTSMTGNKPRDAS